MVGRRTLVIVRHAKSSWRTNDPDLYRPLSSGGTRDAVVAGHQLAPLCFDLALVSPAVRAQQTWQTLQLGGTRADEVRTVEELYHGWASDVLAVLCALPETAERVLVVGHEPTLSEVILTLAVRSSLTAAVSDKFPTSGIAVLSFNGAWDALAPGRAVLEAFEVPRG